MFSSDVSHAETQTPEPDGTSDASSIFPEDTEEDDNDDGYYLSARTADLVRASQRPPRCSQELMPSETHAIHIISWTAGETAAAGAEWQCRRTVRDHVACGSLKHPMGATFPRPHALLMQASSLQTWALESRGCRLCRE